MLENPTPDTLSPGEHIKEDVATWAYGPGLSVPVAAWSQTAYSNKP